MEFEGDVMDFARPGAGDDKLFVVFYMGIIKDDGETITAGRPIYRDQEMVRIYTPGDRNNVPDRPVRDSDKRRWAKQYDAFKQGKDEAGQLQGTPLTEWPNVGRAQSEELRFLGIRTVEQLAEVRDDVMSRVPGLRTLKDTAAIWLGKSKSTAEAAKQAQEMDDLRSQVASLNQAVKELMSSNQALTSQLQKSAAMT